MKILVCISKTPDTTTKYKFKEDQSGIQEDGIQWIINPYDDHALASALQVKEKHGGSVTVIHVGEQSSDAVIRKALAIGADDAIRINTEAKDPLYVASQIATAIEGHDFDLIYTGRESIDYNGNMVGDMLAELLKLPSVAFAKNFEVEGKDITISRFIDGGTETVKTELPVVISAAKELAEPKIPNMRGIMQARTKPLKVVEPASIEQTTEYVTYEAPEDKGDCEYIEAEDAEKLIEILHNKEKLF